MKDDRPTVGHVAPDPVPRDPRIIATELHRLSSTERPRTDAITAERDRSRRALDAHDAAHRQRLAVVPEAVEDDPAPYVTRAPALDSFERPTVVRRKLTVSVKEMCSAASDVPGGGFACDCAKCEAKRQAVTPIAPRLSPAATRMINEAAADFFAAIGAVPAAPYVVETETLPEGRVTFAVVVTAPVAALNRAAVEDALTDAEAHVVAVLAASPGWRPYAEIARDLGLDASDTLRELRALERRGLASRVGETWRRGT